MKRIRKNVDARHPYVRQQEAVDGQGVIVIDDIKSVPIYGEPYIVPNMLILICHEGMLWNKEMPDETFSAHDVSVLLPSQIVMAQRAFDDYHATMIAISRAFYDRLLHSYSYTRRSPRYRRRPATHLTDSEYCQLLDAVALLRTLTCSKSAHRDEMLFNLLSIMLNMIGEFHGSNNSEEELPTPHEQLFSRFYEALIQNYRESHEMAFYARLCCLSPKHFSEVIKKETGISVNEWIATYITLRAKALLDSRQDYTIQQVSHELGFSEQSSFARFFKKHTGMTAKEYREQG